MAQIVYLNFFSSDNMLVGIIMAIGAIMFVNRDFTGALFYRSITFIGVNIFLAIIAYFSNLNVYLGLVLNFGAIFLTTYIYMNDYREPTSYIFLMIYIFMLTTPIELNQLPLRIFSIIFGVVLIMIFQIIFNKDKFKKQSTMLIKSIIKELHLKIDNILEGEYSLERSIDISQKTRTLIILIKERCHFNFKNNKVELNKLNIATMQAI